MTDGLSTTYSRPTDCLKPRLARARFERVLLTRLSIKVQFRVGFVTLRAGTDTDDDMLHSTHLNERNRSREFVLPVNAHEWRHLQQPPAGLDQPTTAHVHPEPSIFSFAQLVLQKHHYPLSLPAKPI